MRLLTITTILLLFSASCARYFIAADFETQSVDHTTIAVLPVEMIFTGKQPKNLTDEDIKNLEEAESKVFMSSLYNEILRSTKNGKKPLRVNVQSYTKSLALLEENGLSIRETWNMSPVNLAKILKVDAVVQAKVSKRRYMGDLASYGIDLGVDIIDNLIGGGLWGLVPNEATRTNTILADFSLINGENAHVLYSRSFTTDVDWSRPANEMINAITRRFARKFPYRK